MRGEKMAKSVGNVVRVADELKLLPGEAIRLNLLTTHYRKPLEYTDDVQRSYDWLERTYRILRQEKDVEPIDIEPSIKIVEALCDDLNTPKTLFELQRLAVRLYHASSLSEKREAKGCLLASAYLLGLLQNEQRWQEHKLNKRKAGPDEAYIEAKVAERQSARKFRDFARADAIRDELASQGIVLEDTHQGTKWRRA
jgi:cysteinyl-tRNA synthetase